MRPAQCLCAIGLIIVASLSSPCRADDPFTYVPYDDALAAEITSGISPERAERMRRQLENARRDVER